LKWNWCIFPYDDGGNLVSEDELSKNAPMEYKLLMENKVKLVERATEEPWYAYGRTQAIKDTFKEKWAVKSTIKDLSEPICKRVPAGSGVYGGLYILTEHPESLKALETQDFMNYVKMLGKYKSGGYYTFSSKELENYLNWSYGKKKD
jgi:adenine-specific DNA-methyltransferase